MLTEALTDGRADHLIEMRRRECPKETKSQRDKDRAKENLTVRQTIGITERQRRVDKHDQESDRMASGTSAEP